MVVSVEVISRAFPHTAIWIFIGALSIPALMLLVLLPLRYLLTWDEVAIHSGLLRWRIPVESILRVTPSKSLRPAPALSHQRLRLDYQKGNRTRSVHLSPTHPTHFLADLVAADPGLVYVEGGGLVRQAGRILPLQHTAP